MVCIDLFFLKWNKGCIYQYLYAMKREITMPDYLHDLKEEDIEAAAKRREEYALVRDLRAKEDNEAIAHRLAKEKEKSEDTKLFTSDILKV